MLYACFHGYMYDLIPMLLRGGFFGCTCTWTFWSTLRLVSVLQTCSAIVAQLPCYYSKAFLSIVEQHNRPTLTSYARSLRNALTIQLHVQRHFQNSKKRLCMFIHYDSILSALPYTHMHIGKNIMGNYISASCIYILYFALWCYVWVRQAWEERRVGWWATLMPYVGEEAVKPSLVARIKFQWSFCLVANYNHTSTLSAHCRGRSPSVDRHFVVSFDTRLQRVWS